MRKMMVTVVVILLVFAGFGLMGCGGPSVIKIGVIAELTGSIPAVGESCKNGTNLAAEEINAAGGISVGGKKYKVELIIKDSAGKPEQAASMAQELINKDKVLGIVGPNMTSNALAAAAEAEKDSVVLVAPWSMDPKTTLNASGKPKKYVFRVCTTASYQCGELAKFSKDALGANKAAVLNDSSAGVLNILAEDFKKSFTAANGIIVASETFKPGDTDFSTQLNKIKAAAPDVLFFPVYYYEVPALLKQVRDAGITAQFLGSNGWSTPDIIAQSGSSIEGSYVFNMYSSEFKDPDTQKFVQAYSAKYKSTPDDVAALSFDALNLLAKGFEGASKLEAKALDSSLLKLREFKGVTGKMRFTADSRNPVRGAALLQVRNGKFNLYKELQPPVTKDEVVAFVKEAVAYAKANGKEKALAEFSNPNGKFKRGELYIYAYNFNNVVLAHGGDPSLVGMDRTDIKDPNGVYVIPELTKLAKNGGGWLRYMWENPNTGKSQAKLGYVEKVDDTWYLGSGTYEPE